MHLEGEESNRERGKENRQDESNIVQIERRERAQNKLQN